MKLRFPYWAHTGIMIFPLVAVLSLILNWMFGTGSLLWVIIPSIIFEQVFEKCCSSFSNNQLINSLFVLVFWFGVGALIGKIGIFKRTILKITSSGLYKIEK